MRQYRILSNGIDYRVQLLGKTFFLKRSKWYWFKEYSYAGGYICEFSTNKEAQIAIDKDKKQFAAKEQGYIPVKNYDE